MRVNFSWLSALDGAWDSARSLLKDDLGRLANTINTVWNIEHTPEGLHRQITASGNISTSNGYGTFSGQHRVFAKISATTLADSTDTVLSFDTPNQDGFSFNPPQLDLGWNIGGMFDPAYPTQFNARVDGLYAIDYQIRFAGNATGVRYGFLTTTQTSAAPVDFCQDREDGAAGGNVVSGSLKLPLKAGWGIKLEAFQSSGGTLALTTGFLNSWLQMTKVA